MSTKTCCFFFAKSKAFTAMRWKETANNIYKIASYSTSMERISKVSLTVSCYYAYWYPSRKHYINISPFPRVWIDISKKESHLTEVVVFIQNVHFHQVFVQTEGHEKSCIFIGQFIVLRLIVHDPWGIHLREIGNSQPCSDPVVK